jgi:hypothetical protein
MKKLLIILYKFPPMGGVGTRRWVKFSKELIRLGYEVKVLTSDYRYKDKVSWMKDVDDKIKVYRFKSYYPQWLLSDTNNNLLIKFKRYANFFLKKSLFYIDFAQYDAYSVLLKAKEIIKKNSIKNIVVSGPPFSLNYFCSYLKIDEPDLNIIQDFRDNWNDLFYNHFPQRRSFNLFNVKEKNAYREFFTLFHADKVINVSNDITNRIKNKYPLLSDKFKTITNSFDDDDFKQILSSENFFDIIYAGSLFNQRIEGIHLLMNGILSLNDKYINDNLKINIYSNFDDKKIPRKYKPLLNKNVFFYNLLDKDKILKKISKSFFCLSINSSYAPYAFGTKIFDYMALNKRILHLSNKGDLSDILKNKKQLVCSYNLDDIKKTLIQLKKIYVNKEENLLINYDEFSLKKTTGDLKELFN